MFCVQCGMKNEDDAVFCSNCGSPMDSEADAAPSSVPSQEGVAVAQSANPNKRTVKIVVLVASLVVVIAVIAGIVLFNHDQANKAKHMPHAVTISFNVAGYTDQDTLIPIRAQGTDLDGITVDELFFVNADGEGISLAKGDYTLSVAASPLTADGILYQDVSTTFDVVVPEDLEDGADVDAKSDVTFDMEKSTALDQTTEMIDAAYDAAVQDPDQVEKADSLVEKARQVHDEAVAAKQREEELARARQNPASVDALNGAVTLKGTVVKQTRTTEETGMGWASVDYLLRFDNPVSITYRAASGSVMTKSFTQIQIDSKELYIASDPDANANIASATIPELQRYVGQYVAVTGSLSDSGNMHTYGDVRFSSGYSITSI